MKKLLSGGVCTAALVNGQSPEIEKLLKSSLIAPLIAYGDGDDGNDDGGEDDGDGDLNGVDPNDPVVKELIRKAVSDATEGLKSKNSELLGEKKRTKEQLDSFLQAVGGEEGLERLKKQREAAENSELDKLLADGKHDEWFEQRTDAMRTKHQRELDALNEVNNALTEERDNAVNTLAAYRVNAAIDKACDELSVKPAYREAVRRMVGDQIQIEEDDDGKVSFVVYEEDGRTPAFGPNGKVMTVSELVDALRDKMGEMFMPSQGGGSTGSGKGGRSANNPWAKGPTWNITEQGRVTKQDPQLAQRLKAEAGVV